MNITSECQVSVSQKNSINKFTVQGEENSRVLTLHLVENVSTENALQQMKIQQKPLDLTGCTVRLYVKKPDGNATFINGKITAAGADGKANTVLFTLTQQTLAAAGNAHCTVAVFGSNGTVLKATGITLDIAADDMEQTIVSTSEFVSLAEALNKAESAEKIAEDGAAEVNQTVSAASTELQSLKTQSSDITAAETVRVDAEGKRVTAETARADAEGKRQTAETARSDAESQRTSNESTRQATEAARAAAESSRASEESKRATAESARAGAETVRVDAEGKRVTAETARADAEGKRQASETARVDAEGKRVTAESDRAAAEGIRQTAETARASAETSRVDAEGKRTSAETARVDSESKRATAETSRADAETVRATAEQARQTAESSRQTAETARESASQAAVNNADKATERANTAAKAAEGVVAGDLLIDKPDGTAGYNRLYIDDVQTVARDTKTTIPAMRTIDTQPTFKLYGYSHQDGVPTPENPIDPVSLQSPLKVTIGTTDYSIPLTASDTTTYPDPLELHSLPTVTDAIINDYAILRSRKFTFNGTEHAWSYGSGAFNLPADTSYNYAVFVSYDLAVIDNMLCDKFIHKPYDHGFYQNATLESISGGGGYRLVFIRIAKSRLTGWSETWTSTQKVTAFKTWLAANPVTIIYQLYTPLTIPLSSDTQTALNNLRTAIAPLASGKALTVTSDAPMDIISRGKFHQQQEQIDSNAANIADNQLSFAAQVTALQAQIAQMQLK